MLLALTKELGRFKAACPTAIERTLNSEYLLIFSVVNSKKTLPLAWGHLQEMYTLD
jgi:hypothetical protein